MENSKIEWCHHTFNPWIGCEKVSQGCKLCYAEHLMDKRLGRAEWGANGTRTRTSESNWCQPLKWNKNAGQAGEYHRVFCASLADVFEDRAELEPWRCDLWRLVESTPFLTWLLLTKRPENITRFNGFESYAGNFWLGTSQMTTTERLKKLLKTPHTYTEMWAALRTTPVTLDAAIDRLQRDGALCEVVLVLSTEKHTVICGQTDFQLAAPSAASRQM